MEIFFKPRCQIFDKIILKEFSKYAVKLYEFNDLSNHLPYYDLIDKNDKHSITYHLMYETIKDMDFKSIYLIDEKSGYINNFNINKLYEKRNDHTYMMLFFNNVLNY